jgi:hypothetical protein
MTKEIKLEEQDLPSLILLRQSFLDSYFTNDREKDRKEAESMLNAIEAITEEMSKRDSEWDNYDVVMSDTFDEISDEIESNRKARVFLSIIFYGLILVSIAFFFAGMVDYATFFLLANYVFGSLAEQIIKQQ